MIVKFFLKMRLISKLLFFLWVISNLTNAPAFNSDFLLISTILLLPIPAIEYHKNPVCIAYREYNYLPVPQPSFLHLVAGAIITFSGWFFTLAALLGFPSATFQDHTELITFCLIIIFGMFLLFAGTSYLFGRVPKPSKSHTKSPESSPSDTAQEFNLSTTTSESRSDNSISLNPNTAIRSIDVTEISRTPPSKEASHNASVSSIDGMEGHAFEHFCADLLRKNSFIEVRVTQGSGDQGVDILATKDGVRYAIQCKNYASNISNKPIQEVYAGKVYYNCHVGVVITNSTFTTSAIKLANATGILLWDRAVLQKMMQSQQQTQ